MVLRWKLYKVLMTSDAWCFYIIALGMQGTNKARMVEYLNATVKCLSRDN
jgi:hypothetical protein